MVEVVKKILLDVFLKKAAADAKPTKWRPGSKRCYIFLRKKINFSFHNWFLLKIIFLESELFLVKPFEEIQSQNYAVMIPKAVNCRRCLSVIFQELLNCGGNFYNDRFSGLLETIGPQLRNLYLIHVDVRPLRYSNLHFHKS